MKDHSLKLADGRDLELSVYYSKGGANYFSGGTERRGYWLSAQAVKVEAGMRSFIIGDKSALRAFLLEVKRQSPKQMEAARRIAGLKARAVVEQVLDRAGLALAAGVELPAAPAGPIPTNGGGTVKDAPALPRKGMLLLTKEAEARFTALGSQDGKGDAALVVLKFFDPCGSWTWYATEWNPADRTFFGYVRGLESEWGSFSLDELNAYRGRLGLGIERDKFWKERPIGDVLGAVAR